MLDDEQPARERRARMRRALRHDLRNPLAIIIGRCELLESEVLGPLGPRQAESVRTISRHALRLADEIAALAELLDEDGER